MYSQLKIEPTNDTSLPEETEDAFPKAEKQIFAIVYEKLFETVYVNSEKNSGLVLKDQEMINRMNKAVGWLLKRIGSTILKGQSIMNISLPVFIFDKRSMLQVYAYVLRLAPLYFEKAFYIKDPLERLKCITTFFLTQLHIACIQSKPFSPIIGETYQTKIGNFNLYLEQTVSKPLTANIYGFDDQKRYKYSGIFKRLHLQEQIQSKLSERGIFK